MKKIGLFGGTFNPPHIGHLMMANEVYAALGLTEVRFMPNAKPPHKEKQMNTTVNDQCLKMVGTSNSRVTPVLKSKQLNRTEGKVIS